MARNVLGEALEECSRTPLTGFYRNGCCDTGGDDVGVHTVCALMTEEFLAFSVAQGNDLVSPAPGFPGLRPGDSWCLCAERWQEALEAGVAPPVRLEATHALTLEWVTLADLRRHSAPSGDGEAGPVAQAGADADADPDADAEAEADAEADEGEPDQ